MATGRYIILEKNLEVYDKTLDSVLFKSKKIEGDYYTLLRSNIFSCGQVVNLGQKYDILRLKCKPSDSLETIEAKENKFIAVLSN